MRAAYALLLVACSAHVTPMPVPDAGTDCAGACMVLDALCGPQPADCVATLQRIDTSRALREPSGRPLSCMDIALAKSPADVKALGQKCGP